MTLDLRGMDTRLRPYAEYALQLGEYYLGVRPTVTSVYRNMQKQAALRKQFDAGKSKYPVNRPGDSAHNVVTGALAFDSWVPDHLMQDWKAIREYVGFRVPENDLVHGELPDWRNYVTFTKNGPRAA